MSRPFRTSRKTFTFTVHCYPFAGPVTVFYYFQVSQALSRSTFSSSLCDFLHKTGRIYESSAAQDLRGRGRLMPFGRKRVEARQIPMTKSLFSCGHSNFSFPVIYILFHEWR